MTEVEYPPVLTKRDFVRRYKAGEFGNAAPTWDTIKEFLESGYDLGPIHIRNRITGADTWYNLEPGDVPLVWEAICRKGFKPDDLYLSAMAPTEKTMFQGEALQTPEGLKVTYTFCRKPMRDALKESCLYATGIRANTLLKDYLCANSYEWLQTLFDRYPEHVVEFSVYRRCWGTLYPRFNTVFWEVRKY